MILRKCAIALCLLPMIFAATPAMASAADVNELEKVTALSRSVAESPDPSRALAGLKEEDRSLVLRYASPDHSETVEKIVPVDAAARQTMAANNGSKPTAQNQVSAAGIIYTGCWRTTLERNVYGIAGNKLYGFSLAGGWCVNTSGVSSAQYDSSWVHSGLWFGWSHQGMENKGAAVLSGVARIFVQEKFYFQPAFQEDHPCLRILGYENSYYGSDFNCSIY